MGSCKNVSWNYQIFEAFMNLIELRHIFKNNGNKLIQVKHTSIFYKWWWVWITNQCHFSFKANVSLDGKIYSTFLQSRHSNFYTDNIAYSNSSIELTWGQSSESVNSTFQKAYPHKMNFEFFNDFVDAFQISNQPFIICRENCIEALRNITLFQTNVFTEIEWTLHDGFKTNLMTSYFGNILKWQEKLIFTTFWKNVVGN